MAEHILVCLSPAPSNANIIFTGARMADAFGGRLTGLYVQTSRASHMGEEDNKRLQGHCRLCERLGGGLVTVAGEDVAAEITEFARLSQVTKVVIGRSNPGPGKLWGKLPLTERLVQLAPNLDIYIIPDTAGENGVSMNPIEDALARPTVRQWLTCLALLTGTTALCALLHQLDFPPAVLVLAYFLSTVLTALRSRSHICSAFASLGAVVLYHLLFTGDAFSLQGENAATFLTMLLTTQAAGMLVTRLADRAWDAEQTASRTKVLFETNQLLQGIADEQTILRLTAGQLRKLLGRSLRVYPWAGTSFPFPQEADFAEEPEAARWALEHRKRSGASTAHVPESRGLYIPISTLTGLYGAVGIDMEAGPLEPFEETILLSILAECALAIQNLRNATEKEAAALQAQNEQLRANLLRSISHDLRTPLTSIAGNAENLIDGNETLDSATRLEVLKDIHADAEWLHRLVENLLSITRIADGRMQMNLSPQLAEEVIAEAMAPIRRMADHHTVKALIPEELLLADMDPRLIIQVLVNLAENAVKYTPKGSGITISASQEGEYIAFSVADQGPGIPDEKKELVFEMFYTGKTGAADCRRSLGLGLALCKSIVEAHGGTIRVSDNIPHGAVFTFTIPKSEVTLNE